MAVNTSVSEAQFRIKGRYRVLVRSMNEQRFNIVCFMICRLRQNWHNVGRSHVAK